MGTATSVLACSNRYPWLGEVNCTQGSVAFGEFGSNASITGIGTDISFVLTAGLSLFACGLVQLFCDRLRHHSYRKLLEPLVVSFGDQQILRGLSLSIATVFSSSACTIDAYRYNVLSYLLMMTIVSHMSSVLVLRSYVNGQIFLSCIRFFLVLAQMLFVGFIFSTRVTDTFPTGIPNIDEAHNTTLVLPAVCFEHRGSKPYSGLEDVPKSHTKDSAALTMYIILFIFYGINLVITAAHVFTYCVKPKRTWEVLHKEEERAKMWSWFWYMGIFRGLILLSAWIIWIWSVIKMYELKHWMTHSGWMSGVNLQNDNQWTFGQLLSILLLAAAPMTVLDAWADFKLEREQEQKRRKEALLNGPSNLALSPMTPGAESQTGLLNPQSPYGSRTRFGSTPISTYSGYSAVPPSYEEMEMQQSFGGIPARQERRPEAGPSWRSY
ncbi:hypothetical protein BDZ45DRAFT_283548 [Acephala macrosclerotiorum]|nr:hypothetical protein BDZ45DRAFT_283548 [Acephala macrosclerotiorum]